MLLPYTTGGAPRCGRLSMMKWVNILVVVIISIVFGLSVESSQNRIPSQPDLDPDTADLSPYIDAPVQGASEHLQSGIRLNGFVEKYERMQQQESLHQNASGNPANDGTLHVNEPVKIGVALLFGSQLYYGIFSLGAVVFLLVLFLIFLLTVFRRTLYQWMGIPSSLHAVLSRGDNKVPGIGKGNSAEGAGLNHDQVEMRGELKKIRFPDLLQLLSSCENTGTLVVQNNHEQKSLSIREGKICFASCMDKDKKNKLGYLLYKLGKITKSERRRALVLCAQNPSKRLGQALIEIGAIDREGLQETLRIQAEEIVYSLMAFPEGRFEFVNEAPPVDPNEALSLDVMNLVMEGARREDEWENMRAVLPSLEVILDFATDGAVPVDGAQLTEDQGLILGLIDGEHTVSEICARTPLVDFEVCNFLCRMIRQGVLQAVEVLPDGVA